MGRLYCGRDYYPDVRVIDLESITQHVSDIIH
ncbi:MAG: hypothetical protein K0Q81_1221 [Paenibacillus sp.]|jgi:hypothetical protein|nr:hypothetical protein [Paenibacillus sp.]